MRIRAQERPFVRYVGNRPAAAAHRFHGLREACRDLPGIALFDRPERGAPANPSFEHPVRKRREIESYPCTGATLEAYARASRLRRDPASAILGRAGRAGGGFDGVP